MKDMTLKNLYQQIILDHNRRPHNCGVMKDADTKQRGYNPLCGDDYTLYIKTQKDTIEKISFEGAGCALSKASASILTDILAGKTLGEAERQTLDFIAWLATDKKVSRLDKNLLIFEGVKRFPLRAKCATLIWHTFLEAIKMIK